MTRPLLPRRSDQKPLRSESSSGGGGGGTAMRLIVPLQGVVQGHGGLVFGSLLPCALFYLLQFYLKRQRPASSPTPPPASPSDPNLSVAADGGGGSISRSLSRGLLSPRGPSAGPAKLSSRGAALASHEDGPYYVGMRRWAADAYHPSLNPGGVIQLGLAENQLSFDLIRDWVSQQTKKGLMFGGLEEEVEGQLSIRGLAPYQPYDGCMDLKMAVAGFMCQVMQGSTSFNPSQIILTAGVAPAMEILGFCLADPGNAFLVPSPYYPGWDHNIKSRTGIELIPVPCRSTDNFSISIPALERSLKQAKKRGVKVRAILLSNPLNPVSNLISRDTLYELIDFVTDRNLHLISHEMYVSSAVGDGKFLSVAELLDAESFDQSRVHIIYGLSEDLSLAGYRVGVVYSYNENVLASASKLARFSSISAPIQRLLASMLLDTTFVSKYIEMNRKRLQKIYASFVDGLKQLGIECVNSSGGVYCWVDMSKFIRSYNEKGELKLWDELLNVGKINIIPGSSCHCIEPGWFQCCFTAITEKDIPVVIERIRMIIENHHIQH